MGLGKTITCVSLIAATLSIARDFAAQPVATIAPPPPRQCEAVPAANFADSVWGMPDPINPGPTPTSAKGKAKAAKAQDRMEADYARACRIKTRSRATLIICPLSTVSNWEDQFREHWRGEVTVFGGSGGICLPHATAQSMSQMSISQTPSDVKPEPKPTRLREGNPLRVYVYHGNARRPDPAFLADFDAVITTYATLASEFSKQNRSRTVAEEDQDEDDAGSSDGFGGIDMDEHGNATIRLPKPKKGGLKRKKSSMSLMANVVEAVSALQSIHWFRVVLDEAQ